MNAHLRIHHKSNQDRNYFLVVQPGGAGPVHQDASEGGMTDAASEAAMQNEIRRVGDTPGKSLRMLTKTKFKAFPDVHDTECPIVAYGPSLLHHGHQIDDHTNKMGLHVLGHQPRWACWIDA